MKNTNQKNIVIIVLIVIVVILLICCIGLFIKEERLEDKYDNDFHDSSNLSDNNDVDNNSNTPNNNYISKDEAINIALKDINVKRNDVYDLDIELEKKYNKVLYEVDFDYKNHEYEYYIDATDGTIFKSFSERN